MPSPCSHGLFTSWEVRCLRKWTQSPSQDQKDHRFDRWTRNQTFATPRKGDHSSPSEWKDGRTYSREATNHSRIWTTSYSNLPPKEWQGQLHCRDWKSKGLSDCPVRWKERQGYGWRRIPRKNLRYLWKQRWWIWGGIRRTITMCLLWIWRLCSILLHVWTTLCPGCSATRKGSMSQGQSTSCRWTKPASNPNLCPFSTKPNRRINHHQSTTQLSSLCPPTKPMPTYENWIRCPRRQGLLHHSTCSFLWTRMPIPIHETSWTRLPLSAQIFSLHSTADGWCTKDATDTTHQQTSWLPRSCHRPHVLLTSSLNNEWKKSRSFHLNKNSSNPRT